MNNSTAANKRLALGFSTQAAMMQVINGERDPVTLEPIVKEVIKVKLPTAAEKKAAKAALAEKRLAKAAAKAAAEAAKLKISFVKGANKKGEPTYDDVGFSRCINATPLSIVSKRDRSDCVWLHNNWNAIEAFKAEGVESNSVGYLRQLLLAMLQMMPLKVSLNWSMVNQHLSLHRPLNH